MRGLPSLSPTTSSSSFSFSFSSHTQLRILYMHALFIAYTSLADFITITTTTTTTTGLYLSGSLYHQQNFKTFPRSARAAFCGWTHKERKIPIKVETTSSSAAPLPQKEENARRRRVESPFLSAQRRSNSILMENGKKLNGGKTQVAQKWRKNGAKKDQKNRGKTRRLKGCQYIFDRKL